MAERTPRRRPTVLVIGAASRDIDPRDPRGWRLGGAVTYAALAIARLGLPARVLIGVDSEAASAHELGLLLAAGCQIELARLQRGPVFDNQETPAGRRQIAHSPSDRIPLRELPRRWRDSDAVLLGPVADELGPAWASAFSSSTLVGLGWQGLMRRLEPGRPVELLPLRQMALIARADIAVTSVEELRPIAGRARLTRLLPRAGQQLLVSNGPRPMLHLRRDDGGLSGRVITVAPAERVADTTGAGDTLLAAWLAGLAATRFAGIAVRPSRLIHFAAATATAKVEAGGLADMPDLRQMCAQLLTPPAPGTG
jgi:sugar/nucleoside kinase (ribokinase family)